MCIQHSRLRQPAPKPEQASLTLIGSVRAPRVFSLAELRDLPYRSRRLTLVCAAHALHAKGWETCDWSGVPFTSLLDAAGVTGESRSVRVAGYDGALQDFALGDLADALLAFEVDGQPLRAAQGFPARLVIPGRTACAMPRFVQRMTFSAGGVMPLGLPQPLVMIERVEAAADGVRIDGQALGAGVVAVRRDNGPAVAVTVESAELGLAGRWSLEWPGANSGRASFSAEALPMASHAEARPLARRWKPQRATWMPARSRES